MERDLFVYERFMLAGGHPWNVMLAARLRGGFDAGSVRAALDGLQRRHPVLQAGIVEERGRHRFACISPAPPIPVRQVERSGEADWFREMAEELDRPLPVERGPMLRLVWLRSDAVSELVLVAHHAICDGRSVLVLLRELIARLRGPDGEPSPARGFSTIAELFGQDPVGGRASRLGLRLYAALGGLVLRAMALRARLHGGPGPTPCYVLQWDMDEAVTEALRVRARRAAISSYAALATAFLRAIHAVQPRETLNRLMCPVDIRPAFAIDTSELLFASPPSVRLSIDRKLDGDFWAQARQLGNDLRARRARLRPDRSLLAAEHLHGLVEQVTNAHLHDRKRNDLSFTHLGELDLPDQKERFGLEAFLALLASMPSPDTAAIQAVRSAGRIRFCLLAREAVLPRADAERLRDLAMAIIELAVQRRRASA